MTTEHQRRVRELFEAALDRPPEVRQEFLAAACGEDLQLHQTVQRLLSYHERSEGVLDSPVWERRELVDEPHEPGSYLGPYKILRELGGGGMGIVYQAVRADEVFQRICAVKVIRTELSAPWLVERFRRERQILARLDHANIARIVDGGSTPDGLPYFVMDYVDGTSITAFSAQHELGIKPRLALFQQVCAAVQYLHQNGVIHGDLKPLNILVGNDGIVKIVDFGIASAFSSTDAPEQNRILPLMTLGYASPEQLRGEPLTPASDLYSLGVILYELLSGNRPFSTAGRSSSEMLNAIATEDPARPSDVTTKNAPHPLAIRQADAQRALRGDLDCIVLRAMHREPERRYRSVAELRGDIESYLVNRPILARNGFVGYRSRKFIARHRKSTLAGVVFSTLLAVLSWQGVELHRRYELSQQLEDQVRSLQTQVDDELRRRRVELGGGTPSHTRRTGPGRAGSEHLKTAQLSNVRDLADACRTSFSESVRLWPGMTPSRRDLVNHARSYLYEVEPYVDEEPGASEQLATAWLSLADLQGNPQTVNLKDHQGAMSSLREAERLLSSSPDASQQLVEQIRNAEAQVESASH